MTIPRKKRKEITVNGKKYEYCVTHRNGLVRVYVENPESGTAVGQDKPGGTEITPQFIKDIIERERL